MPGKPHSQSYYGARSCTRSGLSLKAPGLLGPSDLLSESMTGVGGGDSSGNDCARNCTGSLGHS